VSNVVLLKAQIKDRKVKVKASGGIRSHGDAVAMIGAGASRIGTSAGVAIMEEAKQIRQ
jgi:deoxyribose-phosphate aldolase